VTGRPLALPHRFPFRFLEPVGEFGVAFRVTAGARLPGAAALGRPFAFPLTLAVEGLAQAALALLPREDGKPGGMGSLAAIDGAELLAEIHPGDVLVAEVQVLGRFGPALKVAAAFTRDGERVVVASLLLHVDTF
jgi:hypothetical protein